MRLHEFWGRHPIVRLLVLGVVLPALAYGGIRSLVDNDQYQPDLTEEEVQTIRDSLAGPRDYLVAVFISASFCGANNHPGFRSGVKSLMSELEAVAPSLGYDLVQTVGVSIDVGPDEGIEYLDQFGQFDEVVSGANWVNTGSLKYLLETNTRLAIPQVILIRRRIDHQRRSLKVLDEEVVSVLRGVDQIIDGLASPGVELPDVKRPG